MNTKIRLVSLLLAVLLLATACGTKSEPDAGLVETPVAPAAVAEGHALPVRYAYLSFLAAGRVSEVLVSRGERVTEGQVLARLGDSQSAEAALAGANAELTSAQQAYDALLRTAGLNHARAWQAYLDAQKAAAAARLAWDRLDPTALQDAIDDAQEDVDTEQVDLDKAQADFDEYADLPSDNATRQEYEDDLRAAQTNYDQALQRLVDAIRRRDVVRAQLDAALGTEAEARRAFENSLDGPDADQLALAEARLEAARAQADAAQTAVDNYTLTAPFSGLVADINLTVDQMVAAGTWAVALADTARWYVETSDLSELDVVEIVVGGQVEVVADSLPDVVMTGVVEEIGQAPRIQGGDILYLVRIRLQDPAPQLFWGMTVEVTFPPAE
jgi:multidrug efflux pump subunit AcrA (membrane-fusion protein)